MRYLRQPPAVCPQPPTKVYVRQTPNLNQLLPVSSASTALLVQRLDFYVSPRRRRDFAFKPPRPLSKHRLSLPHSHVKGGPTPLVFCVQIHAIPNQQINNPPMPPRRSSALRPSRALGLAKCFCLCDTDAFNEKSPVGIQKRIIPIIRGKENPVTCGQNKSKLAPSPSAIPPLLEM
jgi:hypothetical protein